MKPWWRVLVVLAFVLPVGGYVVGSLAASSVDDPAPRAPMQLRPVGGGSDSPDTTSSPAEPDETDETDEPIPVEPRLGDLDDDTDDDPDDDPSDDAGDDDD